MLKASNLTNQQPHNKSIKCQCSLHHFKRVILHLSLILVDSSTTHQMANILIQWLQTLIHKWVNNKLTWLLLTLYNIHNSSIIRTCRLLICIILNNIHHIINQQFSSLLTSVNLFNLQLLLLQKLQVN